jgi:hypothetical protein
MHIGRYVKYYFFLSDFNQTRKFSTDFRKILKAMTKLIVAFRNFSNAPKKEISVNCNYVTQGSDLWRPFINSVINISVSKREKNFFKGKRLAAFQGLLLSHEIGI